MQARYRRYKIGFQAREKISVRVCPLEMENMAQPDDGAPQTASGTIECREQES